MTESFKEEVILELDLEEWVALCQVQIGKRESQAEETAQANI